MGRRDSAMESKFTNRQRVCYECTRIIWRESGIEACAYPGTVHWVTIAYMQSKIPSARF